MSVLLSIAIPTIQSRKKVFDEFYFELINQTQPYESQIEIISICDNKEISIGEKRNKLNELAKGRYVVQWDDDDWIGANTIDMIMDAITKDADCISFKVWADIEKEERWKIVYSVQYDNYNVKKDIKNKTLFLPPDQKCPIKKEILDKVKFLDIRYNEDKYFIRSVSKYIKTEFHINEYLYESAYRGNEKDDALTRYGIKKTNNLL